MLKKNLFHNLFLSFTQVIYPIIIFGYTSKIIGPYYLGKIAFIDNFTRQLIVFCSLGLTFYGLKTISESKSDIVLRTKKFIELFTIQGFLTILICLLLYFSFWKINYINIYSEFQTLSILMLIGNALTNDWYFQGIDDYKYILIRSNVIRIIAVILLFITVRTSNDYWYFFMIISITMFINGCVNSYKIVRQNYKNFNTPKWVEIKLHLKPLIYTFLGTFSVSVYLQMDSILLGILGNETSLGIYTVVSKISKVPLYIISAMGVVMTAKIASLGSTSSTSLSNFYNKSLALMMAIVTPMIIFLVVFAESIIMALSGSQFISGQIPLTILTLTILFVGFSNIFGIQILVTQGKENQFAIATAVGMFLNIFLNLILIPKMQLLGTVIALTATEFSVMFITYLYARKYINVFISKSEVKSNALFILLLSPCLVWIEGSISNLYFKLITGLLATIGLFYLVYILRNKPSIIKSLLNDEI